MTRTEKKSHIMYVMTVKLNESTTYVHYEILTSEWEIGINI